MLSLSFVYWNDDMHIFCDVTWYNLWYLIASRHFPLPACIFVYLYVCLYTNVSLCLSKLQWYAKQADMSSCMNSIYGNKYFKNALIWQIHYIFLQYIFIIINYCHFWPFCLFWYDLSLHVDTFRMNIIVLYSVHVGVDLFGGKVIVLVTCWLCNTLVKCPRTDNISSDWKRCQVNCLHYMCRYMYYTYRAIYSCVPFHDFIVVHVLCSFSNT